MPNRSALRFYDSLRRMGFAALASGILMVPQTARSDSVTLFAAASLTDVMTEITRVHAAKSKVRCRCVYGASSSLAKQILNGAPAELFISANQRWMDHLQAREAINPATRVDLLGNRLVLIAHATSTLEFKPGRDQGLAGMLNGSRLVVGDPDHVPAGLYAKAALQTFGVWTSVVPRLARTADVRGALALVARNEAAAGIVYFSDLRRSSTVRLVAQFPADSHPAIVYPAALIHTNAHGNARRMLDFLVSREASVIFQRHGFSTPGHK